MTTHQGLRLAAGVVVENMGATVLVMIPGQHDVLTLTGPAADVVNAVVAGQPVSTDLEPEVELLLSAGVLASPMSRRNLLRAGAIGAGAGIAVLSMPSVAAASSPGGGTSGGAGGGIQPFSVNWTQSGGNFSFQVGMLSGDLLAQWNLNRSADITIETNGVSVTRSNVAADTIGGGVGPGWEGPTVGVTKPDTYTVTVKILPDGPTFTRTYSPSDVN